MLKKIFIAIAFIMPVTAQERPVIKLWPNAAPEAPGFSISPEMQETGGRGSVNVKNVSDPDITVYHPQQANGTSVIVCPGGGYNFISLSNEGTKVCEYLNSLGVTAILLKYRVPRRDAQAPHLAPLQDAQKAFEITREHAEEWGIAPDRIGMIGFSAGGNLAALSALMPKLEQRPNFLILVYPAYLTKAKSPFSLISELQVTENSPPLFIIHADDDKTVPAADSALLYLEYKKKNLPAELHIFAKGGHGFGMQEESHPATIQMSKLIAGWLQGKNFFIPKK